MMNPAMIRKPAAGIMPFLYTAGGGALLPKEGPLLPLELEKESWERVRVQGYNTDGSLPSSQSELDEDEEQDMMESVSRASTSPPLTPTSPCAPDPLYVETRKLLHAIYREWAGDMKMDGANPKALTTLRRLGAEIIDKHKMAFQGMLQKLSIQQAEDIQKLSEVPSMVFSDGITNWGRIVTVISFGAFVAKHLKSIHMENCIGTLADSFTDYLMTQKRAWIVEHNGWNGCVDFFHVEDYESGLRTVLMAFAGVAGLGASLAYMIR